MRFLSSSFAKILASFMAVCVWSATAHAVTFTTARATPVFSGPASDADQTTSFEAGTVVEVTHQARAFYRVILGNGAVGYVPADSLQQAKTKGGPLLPLVVAVGMPVAKLVADKAVGWFQKIGGVEAKAEYTLPAGAEFVLLARESGDWVKVLVKDGKEGYIKDAESLVTLHSVSYADPSLAGIWKKSKPIPRGATALTLMVEVRKADGTPVPTGGSLKLGDEYRIYVTPSADAFVRITCETPDAGRACHYYPNQYPGTQTSVQFKGGATYSTELLPQGVNFKVSEPIGTKDVLRIEATTAGPYHYVAEGDGCAPSMTFKGGGFSSAGGVANPTAQVVVEYLIKTSK